MLQVATGRFHKYVSITKHEAYSTLFSNCNIYQDIRTPIGTLKRSMAHEHPNAYVHGYIQQHMGPGQGVWVWGGDKELNDDLAAAMTLFLPGFFDANQELVFTVTQQNPIRNYRSNLLPSNFLPSKLQPPNTNLSSELKRFEELLEQLVQLPRLDFQVIIEAARAFKRAILALRIDHLLAYSNLVFCLESLSQNLKPYNALWEDVPEIDRTRIEQSISELDIGTQEQIKSAIIEDRQLKLMKRFVSFIEEHIQPDYYLGESSGIYHAIRPSDLGNCMKVAYQIRSGYAHSLTKSFEHIDNPIFANGETFTWEGRTVPTFRGLARILEHVMRTIIIKAERVEPEDIQVTNLVPGISRYRMAPEHALAPFKEYHPGFAQRVLLLLSSHLWSLPAKKPEHRKIIFNQEFIDDAVAKFDQMNPIEQYCTLNLLRLYTAYPSISFNPEWQNLFKASETRLKEVNWPNLVGVVLVGGLLDGDGDSVLYAVEELRRISAKKKGTEIPKDLILAASAIAASIISNIDPEQGRNFNNYLVLEATGRPLAQKLLNQIDGYTITELQRCLLGISEQE